MAQAFDCICSTAHCRGKISGARDMTPQQLEGVWLNGFIREMLLERDQNAGMTNVAVSSGKGSEKTALGSKNAEDVNGEKRGGLPDTPTDSVEQTLVALLEQARIAVQLAEEGLSSYRNKPVPITNGMHGGNENDGIGAAPVSGTTIGNGRAGPTSRELSGEMGGDTSQTI